MPPPAIENVSESDRAAEREPGVDLGHPCIRIAGIGENEEIEVRELAGPGDRIVRGLQPGKNPSHVLVADRHDDRGADIGIQRCVGRGRARNRELVPTQQLEDEARDRGPESARNPGEENREQNQHHDLERLLPVIRQHRDHEIRSDVGLRDHKPEQDDAPEGTDRMPVALRVGRSGAARQAPTRSGSRLARGADAGEGSARPGRRNHRAPGEWWRRGQPLATVRIEHERCIRTGHGEPSPDRRARGIDGS